MQLQDWEWSMALEEAGISRANLCTMPRAPIRISMPIAFFKNSRSPQRRPNFRIPLDQEQSHWRALLGMALFGRLSLQLPRLNCLSPLNSKPAVRRRFLPALSGSKSAWQSKDVEPILNFDKREISYETECEELDDQGCDGAGTRRRNAQFCCPTGIRAITQSAL